MNTSTKTHMASCLILGLAVSTCLGAGEIVGKPYKTGDEPRVDNWVDAWMLAHSGPAGQAVDGKAAPATTSLIPPMRSRGCSRSGSRSASPPEGARSGLWRGPT